MRLARLVPLLAVLLLASWLSAHADEPVSPGADALSSPSTDLDLDIGALPPKGPPKLESSLWQLVGAQQQGGVFGLSVEAERSGIALHDGAVRVVVEAQPGQASAVAAAAASQGGVVETSYGDLVQVLAPVGRLEALSNAVGVSYVRQPTKFFPEVTGEGVGLVNASVWQAAGITGGSVKVAVLDEGFSGYSSLLGGELPSSVITQSFRADHDITGGGEVHGTAVAEIMHEVAPGAQMYLVNFETDPELGNAVGWIVSQGVNVINFSMGCAVCGPGNGTGFANDLVSWAVSNGVVWANGAGNEAGAHWAGDWYNPDGDAWHNFTFSGETNSVYLLAGQSMWVGLKWDDPWGSSCNDYDLCVVDGAQHLMGCTANVQNCVNAHPVEQLLFTAPSSGSYGIAIYRYRAAGVSHFHIYVDAAHPMQYVVAAGSLLIPGDNPDAITVGAVPWSTPDTIEPFSSQGPTEDGRAKPDLVGPDRVSGATYGPSGFAGTSAASPHVAGAAALVKQAFPAYTPGEIKSFLEGRAVPLGAPGKNNIYGSGRLSLGSIPDADGDGVIDGWDNCPATSNPGQRDHDGDGVGDICDNCPATSNGDQASHDSDRYGDTCDADDDGDGFLDAKEVARGSDPLNLTCANALDEDGDGKVNDGCPLRGAAESGAQCDDAFDSDSDTWVNDGCPVVGTVSEGSTPEVCDGIDNDGDTQVDEGFPDSDGDGTKDCLEANVDTDGDTLVNTTDTDDDNDGFLDSAENWMGTDSLDACPDDRGDDAWPPDINNDGRVNIQDLARFWPIGSELGGSGVKDYRYDRRYDLNGDAKIDVRDLAKIKAYMGRSCRAREAGLCKWGMRAMCHDRACGMENPVRGSCERET
jgi:hypothetical protein